MVFLKFLLLWWKSAQRNKAYLALGYLVIICIVDVLANVGFIQWQKQFFDALERKDVSVFFHQILMFFPVSILVLTSFVGTDFLKSFVGLRWRGWMSKDLSRRWLDHQSYYKIPLHGDQIDNPDQRIAQDIKDVTQNTTDLFVIFFKSTLNLITFSYFLWIIGGPLVFVAAVIYSFLAIFITSKVGKPLIALDQTQEKVEANFRYRLMRIMEKKEEIAKLSGEKYEQLTLDQSFNDISLNYMKILIQKIYLDITEILHGQGNMFIPLILVGPFYFQGLISLGVLMQIRAMFYEVYRSLSAFAYEYQKIASLRASCNRLIDFSKRIEETCDDINTTRKEGIFELKNLCVLTPQGKIIWNVPDFCLSLGDKKVLKAPSGTGKTSLVRVISGIYPYFTGKVQLPPKNQIMIIPQRTYMNLGTLRNIVCYPGVNGDLAVEETMHLCGLSHLIPLLDIQDDYTQILSAGEQQRINFVRVLLQKPLYLIMDEPISALDESAATKLLSLLSASIPNSAILLFSHTPASGFEEI